LIIIQPQQLTNVLKILSKTERLTLARMQRATDADFEAQLKDSARRLQSKSTVATPDPEAIARTVRIQERVDKTLAKRAKLRELEAKREAKRKEQILKQKKQECGDTCTAEAQSKKTKITKSKQPARQSNKKGKATATPTVTPNVRPIRNAARAVDYREEPGDMDR
jgi:cell division septation protein DedD